MTYSETDILKKILSRTDFDEPLINIKKVFSACDIGNYWSSACDRIADAELIDMEHVFIDIDTPGNLMIDCEGVSACRDVLEGCLGEEHFEQLKSYSNQLRDQTEAYNTKLRLWRKAKTPELVSFIVKYAKVYDVPRLRKEAMAELASRTRINKAVAWAHNTMHDIYLQIKYRHIVKVAKQAAARATK